MKHRIVLTLGYLATAFFVTTVWTYYARTEAPVELPPEEITPGATTKPRFSSIVALADGDVMAPFIKRRLFIESAQALNSVLPSSAAAGLAEQLQGNGPIAPLLRRFVARAGWQAEQYSLLLSAFGVMWLSAAGLMFTCRWLVTHFYRAPRWLADGAGAMFGVALLGGNGDWHCLGYPYDFTQAFLFTLTLAGMLAARPWFIVVFAAAAYSKETSALLIAAYLLVGDNRRSARCWAMAALLAAIFAAVRYGVDLRFPSGPNDFWFPGRNLRRLFLLLFFSWYAPFLGVALGRFLARRRDFPPDLKRLSLLALPLLGGGFLKGWIEEMRQYLELMPVVGLMVFQWALHEAGRGHLLQPRWRDAEFGPERAERKDDQTRTYRVAA